MKTRDTENAHHTRAGASSGSGSPLWDLGHFRMKCLPCSSLLSDLTSDCRAKWKNILGGSHLETPMCPVGSSSRNPCRNGANPLPHTRAGAGQSHLRKPCWNSLLCGQSQEKGEFRELRFRDTLLSHFLFIVVGHALGKLIEAHFIDKETEASVYWPKILWSENRRA